MTMVDKIAKAIARAAVEQNHMLQYFEDNGIGYFDDYDNKNYDCIAIARAAIEAMLDPTEAMLDAGWATTSKHVVDGRPEEIWPAMIQAALKEVP